VECEANQRAGWARQRVGRECDQVAVRCDMEVDNLLYRLRPEAASQEDK